MYFREHDNNFCLRQRNLYRNYSSQLYGFHNSWLRALQSQPRLWNSIFIVLSWKDDLNTIRALKRLAWSYLSVTPFQRCHSSVSRVEKDVYIIYIIHFCICLSTHKCQFSQLMINTWNVNTAIYRTNAFYVCQKLMTRHHCGINVNRIFCNDG